MNSVTRFLAPAFIGCRLIGLLSWTKTTMLGSVICEKKDTLQKVGVMSKKHALIAHGLELRCSDLIAMLNTVRAGVDGDLDGDLAHGMDRDLPGKAHLPDFGSRSRDDFTRVAERR